MKTLKTKKSKPDASPLEKPISSSVRRSHSLGGGTLVNLRQLFRIWPQFIRNLHPNLLIVREAVA